ncbi:MAG: aldo/keto reductase [Pseudomonadota bacterium]
MKQRQLGTDGPMVGAVGLGCMSFSGMFGPTTEEASLVTMQAAVDAGITFWDTSNIYGAGTSEAVIGKFLKETGAKIVLATKVGIVRGADHFDNSPDHIRAELEGSLKRLNRDKVELYYIHRREQARPVEEVAETMAKLIEEGLIDSYGLSEVAPSTLRRAHAVHPCRAVQNEYSLMTRLPELGLIQTCAELGVAFVPFSPVARGYLTDRSISPTDFAEGEFRSLIPRFNEPNLSFNAPYRDALRDFARARGWTTSALAIAWTLHQGDHQIPIPATRTPEHLAEWLAAPDIALSPDDRAELDRIMPVGWAHGDRYWDSQAQKVERYC